MRETWQPIATAPHDGQHILACDETRTFGWDKDGKPWPVWQTVVHWFGDGFYISVSEQEPQCPFHATHWKSISAPIRPDGDEHAVLVERIAEAIYDAMRDHDPEGRHKPWTPRGNSRKQDEARARAREVFATPTPEERPDGQ